MTMKPFIVYSKTPGRLPLLTAILIIFILYSRPRDSSQNYVFKYKRIFLIQYQLPVNKLLENAKSIFIENPTIAVLEKG